MSMRVGIDGGAGVADGGHEASPVGIGAGPGGLHKRRVGDGFGDFEGVGVGGGPGDAELDDVGDALAIGNDLAGKRSADLGECSGEVTVVAVDSDAAGA